MFSSIFSVVIYVGLWYHSFFKLFRKKKFRDFFFNFVDFVGLAVYFCWLFLHRSKNFFANIIYCFQCCWRWYRILQFDLIKKIWDLNGGRSFLKVETRKLWIRKSSKVTIKLKKTFERTIFWKFLRKISAFSALNHVGTKFQRLRRNRIVKNKIFPKIFQTRRVKIHKQSHCA